jgi:hypothetical protein
MNVPKVIQLISVYFTWLFYFKFPHERCFLQEFDSFVLIHIGIDSHIQMNSRAVWNKTIIKKIDSCVIFQPTTYEIHLQLHLC